MNKNDIKIGDIVYVIRKYGSYRDGFEIQIIKYEAKWLGEETFIPANFEQLSESYQTINYDCAFKTLDEAKKAVETIFSSKYNISFKDKKDSYCDVTLEEKEVSQNV